MGGATKALIGTLILAVLALGALIGIGLGGNPSPAAASQVLTWDSVQPKMELVTQPDRALARGAAVAKPKGGKPKKPSITDLITSDPVTVEAGAGRIAALSCGKSMGIALDGGVITPGTPPSVLVSVLSRANPNPPFANSRRNYYVGVSNLGSAPATFRGTLVCAKGIDVR